MKDFFERHSHRIEPEMNSGCWLWSGADHSNGYGLVQWRGRSDCAHRAAYEAANGEGTTAAVVVRHKCDTPACVNPAHLLIGTHADNMRDKRERGRQARGEGNGNAKLTISDIIAIRARCRPGDKRNGVRPIARELRIDAATVRDIVLRRIWKHVA